ncbi:hypothetical protein [Actinospica sp.]|jgi:hypothetical protein|uniref:hypothetical protein n=1 Tax=Actinospica sp. TaxID=1872142 RepID=UPI002C5FFB42|nr:hypothetical protein [Actinospica sp.]HWG26492.1 hypothetical protein [Actinospica sp.]
MRALSNVSRPKHSHGGSAGTTGVNRKRGAIFLGTLALTATMSVTLFDANPAFAAVTPGGMVSDDWSFSGAPSAGLTKLAFPITVTSQPDASSYYWAQQFYFKNLSQGAYIGLQPRSGGGEAIFSVFGSGTSSSNSHCSTGADGGSGTSCAISYPYRVGAEYELEVIESGTNSFTGSVVDDSTGARTTIGSWSVAGAGNLKPSGVGFQEYYDSVSSCSAIPYGQAHFSRPFTNTGDGTGAVTSGSTYGHCASQGSYTLDGNGGITMTGK